MKARIEKKICKKLAQILPPEFYRDAWTDSEVTEKALDQGSRVSGLLCVGGGVDYWGEGQDEYTVLEDFKNHYDWHPPIYNPYPDGHQFERLPMPSKKRLTGYYLIKCAKKIAKNKQQTKPA